LPVAYAIVRVEAERLSRRITTHIRPPEGVVRARHSRSRTAKPKDYDSFHQMLSERYQRK